MRLAYFCLLLQLAACDVIWRPWTTDNPTACRLGASTCPTGTSCNLELNQCAPVTAKLDAVTPPFGPTSGGIPLVLNGEEFHDGAIVTIDGQAALDVLVESPTRITALLPPRPGILGRVAVVVQNPDEGPASRDDLFAYYASDIMFSNSSVAAGAGGRAVVVGDWNGDTHPDLAIANETSSDLSVLLGDGAGGFGAANNISFMNSPIAVAAGDVSGNFLPPVERA